jgi:hypothetical protein
MFFFALSPPENRPQYMSLFTSSGRPADPLLHTGGGTTVHLAGGARTPSHAQQAPTSSPAMEAVMTVAVN